MFFPLSQFSYTSVLPPEYYTSEWGLPEKKFPLLSMKTLESVHGYASLTSITVSEVKASSYTTPWLPTLIILLRYRRTSAWVRMEV